ncbi:putative bifunctional diguanylate cyclase/phosphodiesterase [Delftia sp. PS-11]|uniref:putative bifunctional diguanylate cyclase/phosphodiesterase n=1 Tax=Delftia sp. PS-11 TaxID=2767222 RepID=UPI002453C77A|nr:EAL domain-containing protein [Delftia sp. PS-11]KAJ8743487.1 EAL domain-containing protein [Delftia sp. PS-11]
MQDQGTRPRISLRGAIALYICTGLLGLCAVRWLLDWLQLSPGQSWGFGLLAMALWLLATALAATALAATGPLARMRRADGVHTQSVQELALLARHAPAGMAQVLLGGARIGWANERLAGWLGRSAESLQGEDFRQLVPPDDPQETLRLFDALIAGHIDSFQVQRRCVHAGTGQITPVLCTASLVDPHSPGPATMVCVLQDLGALLGARAALADERQRLAATVVDNTIEGVVVTDAHSRILSVNSAFTRLMGYTEEEMLGKTPRMFKSGRHDQAFYDAMWASMSTTGHWQGEIWNRRKSGEIFPEHMSLSAVKDATGAVTHYVCMFTDISAEKAREAQLEFLAHRDMLTGLPNRARFAALLGDAVAEAAAAGSALAVMLINIDRFKDVNDSYGHAIGDQVLRHIAARVHDSLGEDGVIGRMAGDELAVLFKGVGERGEAIARARHLIAAAGQPWRSPDGLSVVAGVSVGICMYPAHADNAQDLLQGAHAAVYGAKSRSGRAWCFFQEDMTHAARERLALEARLRQALDLGHLRLYFQPQIDLGTGRLVGAEALVRWLDPEEGLISPARFIPVAESSGVIGPLGLWVLREACAMGQRWREQGLPEMTIAVNVSLHQFLLTDIAGATADALAATGFPPHCLELEITESALAERPEEAMAVMRRLRAQGLRLAIDDFGTGYSSLAHLKRFPLDLLKIDQGFIRDIPHSADDMAISGSVIALGHAMGLKVLAEGVETREQLEFLRSKGCDHFQGYLCSRPLPAEDFGQWVQDMQGQCPAVP